MRSAVLISGGGGAVPSDPHRLYEFRCPVHGFIQLNAWERELVGHKDFQRLRRIRQLAWTDQIYPGAMHTRFEHSLGVMHVATRLFDAIKERSKGTLENKLSYQDDAWGRHRQFVRLAALLHDVGHGPFSHAGEELMPCRPNSSNKHEHEDYSSAIIRSRLNDVINNHPLNTANWGIRAETIADLLVGNTGAAETIFWRDLVTGQLDADRMDYLLRDALHTGARGGGFDLDRIVSTIVAIDHGEQAPRLGISEGGVHAAESLVLARFFMFMQVYFHRTRIAYDHHLQQAMKVILPNGQFPSPTSANGGIDDAGLDDYLNWDDWCVESRLRDGEGGEHGQRLLNRNHYREAFHTVESPGEEDIQEFEQIKEALGTLVVHEAKADKGWYKIKESDVPVLADGNACTIIKPLSHHSTLVGSLKPIAQRRLYVLKERQVEAETKRDGILSKRQPAHVPGSR